MGKLLERIEVPHDRFEIRLSGSGGQGMIFASVVLSEAIGANGKRNVVQTQSYGPEARGGASKADVVTSLDEIYYPKAMQLDLLLAMTQEALDSYYSALKPGGMLVVDTTLVTDVPTEEYYGLPFTRMAREQAGHVVVANVVAVGAICGLTSLVDLDTITTAVLNRAPKGTEDRNRMALSIGYQEAAKLKQERQSRKESQ